MNPAQIIRLSLFIELGVTEEVKNNSDDYNISPIAFTLPYSKNLITYNQKAIKQLATSHSQSQLINTDLCHEPNMDNCENAKHRRQKQQSTVETLLSQNKIGSHRPPTNAVKTTFSMKNIESKYNKTSSLPHIKYNFVPNTTKNANKSPIRLDTTNE